MKFNTFLSNEYGTKQINISFRESVTRFIRIWGKMKDDVDKPLNSYHSEKEETIIIMILKIFNEYSVINEDKKTLDINKSNKTTLNKANKLKLIDKPTKSQYDKNLIRIDEIKNELQKFTSDPKYNLSHIKESLDKEFIDLRKRKDKILQKNREEEIKLDRILKSLAGTGHVKSKDFGLLKTFFKEIDIEKIEKIELFHSKIGKILKKELQLEQKKIEQAISKGKDKIEEINLVLFKNLLTTNKSDEVAFFDKIVELNLELDRLIKQNSFFDIELGYEEVNCLLEERVTTNISNTIGKIEDKINLKLSENYLKLYSNSRQTPKISLSNTAYNFSHSLNTGTGKSHADVILLDFVFFKETILPIIIHDTIMYQNIEPQTMEMILDEYLLFEKQSFISIDGINRFNSLTKEKIIKNHRIKLSRDNTLFTTNWG